jgi:hypothetical protein
MALDYKSISVTTTNAAPTLIYSCGVTSTIIKSILIHNDSGTSRDMTLNLAKSGSASYKVIAKINTVNQLAVDQILEEPLVMNNGDVLQYQASGADVMLTMNYVENTTSFAGHSVKELTDWSNNNPLNGNVPVWDSSLGEYVPTASSGTISDTDGLSEGTTNLYYTDARADARIAAASIEDLSDVASMTPTTNQVLQWNGSTWTAGTVTGGGSGVSSLNTLTGGLTLAAGSNVTITDNGTDTITVASTGGGSSTLDGLTDVSATSPTNGDVIVYASGTSTWTTSGALQNLVALLKQPTTDTTTIEADTNNKVTIDKTSAAEKVVATVDGTDALVIKDTHVETKGVIVENQGRLTLRETTANGTNYIGFQAPASVTTSTNFVMPDGDGTAGQFLKTDGSANLSWATPSGGGGGGGSFNGAGSFFLTGFTSTTTSQYYGFYTQSTSMRDSGNWQHYMIHHVPAAGQIDHVSVHVQGGTQVKFAVWKASSMSASQIQSTPTYEQTIPYTSSNYTEVFSPSSWTFSAGDELAFAYYNVTGNSAFYVTVNVCYSFT